MSGTAKRKPKKPYPSFPLTAHPNGQWCKKIRGKVHFFGVWADPDTAHQAYLASAADLQAGRLPAPSRLSPEGLPVKTVGNAFLNWQKAKMEAGDIGAAWYEDCRVIIRTFCKSMGYSRLVSDLRPDDFQSYCIRRAKDIGAHARTREIVTIRGMFKYAYECGLIEHQMRFGTGFKTPSASLKRKEKAEKEQLHGKRLFQRDDILTLLDGAADWMKAAILLGINGGFGNTDCAKLPWIAVNLEAGVIEYNRPKTGIKRIVPLWPETVEALRQAYSNQPKPANKAAQGLALLLPTGRPVVREIITPAKKGKPERISRLDILSREFTARLKEKQLHRQGIGFYTLRHTFRTWADEARDQHAVHLIMGHVIPGMSGLYVEEISLDRLRAVAEHVRAKLYPGVAQSPIKSS